jgi:hypothetical protein
MLLRLIEPGRAIIGRLDDDTELSTSAEMKKPP